MIWETILGAALEVGLGLIATVGFEQEARAVKERLTGSTQEKREQALQVALDAAIENAGASAISSLLHERWFQEEVIAALLDPVQGFDVQKVAQRWETQLPNHRQALRWFFGDLERALARDETWGPVLVRYQNLRSRDDVRQALASRSLGEILPERIVRKVSAELTGAGAIAQHGGIAAGQDGLAVGYNHGQIVHIVNYFVSGVGAAAKADVEREYLKELSREANILPWSRIFKEYADPNKGVTFELEDVYTSLDTTEMEDIQEELAYRRLLVDLRMARRERVSALQMLNRCERLLLMGDPGSGKSTLSKYLAFVLAQARLVPHPDTWLQRLEAWQHGALLPIRLELRELAAYAREQGLVKGNVTLINRYIDQFLKDWGLAAFTGELLKHIRRDEGNVLFLLDGLDEVPTTQRQQVVDMVNALRERYPHQRYLVTCRPYAYIGQRWRLGAFKEATLAPFNEGQIAQFTRNWYAQLVRLKRLTEREAEKGAADVQQQIKQLKLDDMAQNPLLLTAMTHLHVTKHKLPSDRVGLYDEVVQLLFERWESRLGEDKGALATLAIPGLKKENLLKGLAHVAYRAHALQRDEEDDTQTADIPEGMLAHWLSGYLGDSKDKADVFVQYIRERAGLLIRHKTEAYTFPHRSFQEFLAAQFLATYVEEDVYAEVERLAGSDLEHWREVLVMLAGYLARQGRTNQAVAVVNELMPFAVEDMPDHEGRWWRRSFVAARGLMEIGLPGVNSVSTGKASIARMQSVLMNAMREDVILTAKERAEAGRLLGQLGDPRLEVLDPSLIEWIDIPAGPFLMGSKKEDLPALGGEDLKRWLEAELPQHAYELPQAFRISRFPVTAAQYQVFVDDGGYGCEAYWPEAIAADLWRKGEVRLYTWDASLESYEQSWVAGPADYGSPFSLPNHPLVGVSWYEALAFTRWLTKRCREQGHLSEDWEITLPSEAQWEKAARGTEGRIFAWGDAPDPQKANYADTGIGSTSAVGCFPSGASPYAVEEMSGNVFEWTRSLWGTKPYDTEFSYPYNPDDGREHLEAPPRIARVLRGGSWLGDVDLVRCAVRLNLNPDDRRHFFGFRVVCSPSPLISDR